jgi:energy-converting hydrogenase A subunit R
VKRLFISDCEGPISKNDNAFEVTANFVPNGDKLFTVISRYDDVLADIVRRPSYTAGDTLKLILPFLKAFDVTDQKIREFSSQNLILIPNIKETLKYVRTLAYTFIVSTSYEHYIKVLCKVLDFPYENTYSTKLNLNKYALTMEEKEKLKEIAKEITKMPLIEIPEKAKSLRNLSEKDKKIIQRLDEIFWKEIANMNIGKILFEVKPVGGSEKAEAVKDAAERLGIALSDVVYIGDSITDVEAFRLVRENGGLTISFNGNQYAVRSAEIAVLSKNSMATAIIVEVFSRFGKQKTLRIAENWSLEALKKSKINEKLLKRLVAFHQGEMPKVKIITKENMETLAKESSDFRKRVRGENIGRLG